MKTISVPELGMGAFAIGIPVNSGNFGIGYSTFGNNYLRQSHTTLSYGRTLGKNVRAGVGVHYLLIRQPEDYPDLYAVLPSVGLQAKFNHLIVGIFTFNPANQQYLPEGNQSIPAGWYAGAGYHFGDDITVCMEMQKGVHAKAQYCGGIEIQLQKKILFRFGIRPEAAYAGYTLGLGFRNDHLIVDMAIMKHPVLSYSTALTVSFKLNSPGT